MREPGSFSSFENTVGTTAKTEKLPEVVQNLETETERNLFLLDNIPLIHFVVKKYFANVSPDKKRDLFQIGVIGLSRAIDKFDSTLGFEFSTYATPWIRQAISRELSQKEEFIRIPADRQTIRQKLTRAEELFEQLEATTPNDLNLAAFLECSVELIQYVRENCSPIFVDSLDIPINDDETPLVDILEDTSEEINDPLGILLRKELSELPITREELLDSLQSLPERNRQIFIMHVVEGMNFQQISKVLGMTPEGARKNAHKTLSTLRTYLGLPQSLPGLSKRNEKPVKAPLKDEELTLNLFVRLVEAKEYELSQG